MNVSGRSQPSKEVVPVNPAPLGTLQAILTWLKRWEVQLVFLLLVASLANSLLSPYFLDAKNLFDMTFNFMEKAIIALTMTFIIIRSDIDLSVASNLAMSAIVMASVYQLGINIWVAVLVGLLVGLAGGAFNGLVITKVRLPALVVTLGTYALYRGIAWTIVGDLTVKDFPTSFNYIGQGYLPGTPVPFALVLFLLLALFFGLVLHRTTFGRYVYAIGQNEEACRFSGVRVDRIKIVLFAASGLMSALAGVVLAARYGSARADIGLGMELEVITAVVLGGVDIAGGSGTIPGVVLAVFLLGVVKYGMSLINIRGQDQSIVVGLLLITAILVPNLSRQLRTGRREQRPAARRLAVGLSAALAVPVLVAAATWQLGVGPLAGRASDGSSASPQGGVTPITELALQPTPTPKVATPTPTPRAQAGVPMIEIPAGVFTVGSGKFEPNEAPPHEVELPTFYIDQFETTNADFERFVKATGYVTDAEKAGAKKTWRTEYTEGKDSHPVVRVTFNDAQAYCQWASKRLPTEEEWEKAARGTDARDYPWGRDWDSTRANGKRSGLQGTAAVGSFPQGASPYGVEDMAGNVKEWTNSLYRPYPSSTYRDEAYEQELHVIRGGGWMDDQKELATTARKALPPDANAKDLGFRCAANARP